MSQRTSLPEWLQRTREWLSARPAAVHDWGAELREEPAALWRSPLVRWGAWLITAVAALLFFSYVPVLPRWTSPASVADQPTPWAMLHVACAACDAAYTAQAPRDFQAWPMRCEKCAAPRVYRARRCAQCREWVAQAPGAACGSCARRGAKAETAQQPTTRKTGDDAEDPW